MDSSLASIWDEPAVEISSKPPQVTEIQSDDEPTTSRPQKRKSTLFLSDSEDDAEPPGPSRFAATRSTPPPDIDALFAEFDDDDLVLAPLPARLDEKAAARKAEARHRRNIPSSAPPSSPSRNNADGTSKKDNDDGGDAKKARRKLLKLDENRLLGPNGFPQLIKMTKDFKIKGKGHEATDLNRLLQTYQFWTHQLYPKTQFRDTVERVEKLTHSRRMNVALSVWRDEALGISKPLDDSENDDVQELENGDRADGQRMNTNERLPSSRSSPIPSSRASSPPPTSGAESDVLMQPPAGAPNSPSQYGAEDEDEAFWRSMDDFGGESVDAHAPPPVSATVPPVVTATADDDDDMWDLIDEIEQSTSAANSNTSAPVPVPAAPQPAPATNDADPDDWDDMYL